MPSFYLDEDSMRRGLAGALQAVGLDCVTAVEAENLGRSDAEQLTYASATGCVMYTQNVRDFRILHQDWAASGRQHAGIVALGDQRASIGVQVRALQRLVEMEEEIGFANRFFYLQNYRD